MSKCSNFIAQKTDIEQLCKEISISYGPSFNIIFTPTFHCKIAGEGIEYSWDVSKKHLEGNQNLL